EFKTHGGDFFFYFFRKNLTKSLVRQNGLHSYLVDIVFGEYPFYMTDRTLAGRGGPFINSDDDVVSVPGILAICVVDVYIKLDRRILRNHKSKRIIGLIDTDHVIGIALDDLDNLSAVFVFVFAEHHDFHAVIVQSSLEPAPWDEHIRLQSLAYNKGCTVFGHIHFTFKNPARFHAVFIEFEPVFFQFYEKTLV